MHIAKATFLTIALVSPILAGASSLSAQTQIALHETPRERQPFAVEAPDGVRNIAAPNGKLRLINLWATWCPPCREEMASLDRLQDVLGADDFEVVAISVDDGDAPGKVNAFFARNDISHLTAYFADKSRLARAYEVWGIPTTIVLDGAGREIARLVGPAQWDSVDMVAFFLRLLERETRVDPDIADTGTVAPYPPDLRPGAHRPAAPDPITGSAGLQ